MVNKVSYIKRWIVKSVETKACFSHVLAVERWASMLKRNSALWIQTTEYFKFQNRMKMWTLPDNDKFVVCSPLRPLRRLQRPGCWWLWRHKPYICQLANDSVSKRPDISSDLIIGDPSVACLPTRYSGTAHRSLNANNCLCYVRTSDIGAAWTQTQPQQLWQLRSPNVDQKMRQQTSLIMSDRQSSDAIWLLVP